MKKKHSKHIKTKFSIYRLLKGKSTAKKFSLKKFKELYDPKKAKNISHRYYYDLTRREKFRVYCSSLEEVKLIKKMDYHKDFKLLRTQYPLIPFKKKGYHPDIFMLTKTNRIAVIEVKPQFNMNEKTSKTQYSCLKSYCIKHGYMYLMCDRNFKDCEKIKSYYIPKIISESVTNAIKHHNSFNYGDYQLLINNVNLKRKKVQNYIGRYVSKANLKQKGRYSKKMKIYK